MNERRSPPPCQALLFDLDGTLVDSRRDIAGALNAALTEQGLDALALEAIHPMIGDGARALVARGLAAQPRRGDVGGRGTAEDLLERTLAGFVRSYTEHPCVHTQLLPGAREALAVNVPRAVVTNKPRAITLLVLAKLGIADLFGTIWAGGDGALKPAPDGVKAAAEHLGVPIAKVWLVGDGPQDVLAGRAAGCFTIVVPGIAGHEDVLEAKPDLVVESLLDVARLATSA